MSLICLFLPYRIDTDLSRRLRETHMVGRMFRGAIAFSFLLLVCSSRASCRLYSKLKCGSSFLVGLSHLVSCYFFTRAAVAQEPTLTGLIFAHKSSVLSRYSSVFLSTNSICLETRSGPHPSTPTATVATQRSFSAIESPSPA